MYYIVSILCSTLANYLHIHSCICLDSKHEAYKTNSVALSPQANYSSGSGLEN
jgi:hypothetical protein